MGIKDRLDKIAKVVDVPSKTVSRSPASSPSYPSPSSRAMSEEREQVLKELRAKMDTVMAKAPLAQAITPHRQRHDGARRLANTPHFHGQEVSNSHGSFFLVEEVVAAARAHGIYRIGDFADACTDALSLLANHHDIGKHGFHDALFLDLETTGLAGGTGTFPFMIGLGWLDGNDFTVRQLFARDHSEEKAMLAHLKEILDKRGFIITFNGKAYDVNLLSTRFVLNRIHSGIEDMPHLDLLHPCRRVFRDRLGSCTLTNIEASVLEHHRENNIPGYEIPDRYFRWLHRRDPTLVSDIFHHNRLDIISLAGLTWRLSRMLVDGDADFERDSLNIERLKIKRAPDNNKNIDRLVALSDSNDASVALEAMKTLSLIYKKEERWEEAATIWQKMFARNPNGFFAVEEMAKFYEHKSRDYRRAMGVLNEFTEAAIFIPREQREEIKKRLERMGEKLKKR